MILNDIIETKKNEIADLKHFYRGIDVSTKSEHSLYEKLKEPQLSYILELKKASPSRGLIREHFNVHDISQIYSKYASAISVLTDRAYFSGDYSYLNQIRQNVDLPILCKDFIIDPFQIRLARFMGADVVLLMLSILDDDQYLKLRASADELNMDVLTEVHDLKELHRALKMNAKIIGINNRDFTNLKTDIRHTSRLLEHIPDDQVVISESGFDTYDQIKKYERKIHGVLIGSTVMASANIELKIRELMYNRIKICGITDEDALKRIDEYPITYSGHIFAPSSKRKITLDQITKKQSQISKRVAVFQNQTVDEIQNIVEIIEPDIIQLHGNENEQMIQQLKFEFPDIEIWKSSNDYQHRAESDRTLYDYGRGGSGKTLDWNSFTKDDTKDAVIAGGLNPDNICEVITKKFYAYDVNSGVEQSPGVKSDEKLKALFENIRIKSK